jgi:hypothetical protein
MEEYRETYGSVRMQHSHDTPPQVGYFNNGNRLDGTMPLQKLT